MSSPSPMPPVSPQLTLKFMTYSSLIIYVCVHFNHLFFHIKSSISIFHIILGFLYIYLACIVWGGNTWVCCSTQMVARKQLVRALFFYRVELCLHHQLCQQVHLSSQPSTSLLSYYFESQSLFSCFNTPITGEKNP